MWITHKPQGFAPLHLDLLGHPNYGRAMTLSEQIAASRAALMDDIEGFMADRAMSASHFGRLAMGDSRFVYEMRRGRKVEPETMDNLRLFMKAYRPPKKSRGGNDRVAA